VRRSAHCVGSPADTSVTDSARHHTTGVSVLTHRGADDEVQRPRGNGRGRVASGEQTAVGGGEVFQVVGVDELSWGAPVPEGGGKLGQVAQAGRAATVRPVLELADPVVRQPGPGVGGVVPLGQLPLRPPQSVPPGHPGPQVEPATHLGGDLSH
jgi:hypothetical protein